MNVLRSEPSPIIIIGSYVYKFASPGELLIERQWIAVSELFKIFNAQNFDEVYHLEVPNCQFTDFFMRTEFLGPTVLNTTVDLCKLYETMLQFGRLFAEDGRTFSLGDFQLRNLYSDKHTIRALDLGEKTLTSVNVYYDRARFLLHLVDLEEYVKAMELFANDDDRIEILVEMRKRAKYLVSKRIRGRKVASALFRYFNFQVWVYRYVYHRSR